MPSSGHCSGMQDVPGEEPSPAEYVVYKTVAKSGRPSLQTMGR